MTDQQKLKAFFAMLSEHGINEVICINPPDHGDPIARIEPGGELSTIDTRDGERKKINLNPTKEKV